MEEELRNHRDRREEVVEQRTAKVMNMKSFRFKFSLIIILSLLLSVFLPVAGGIILSRFLAGREWIDVPLHSVAEALGSFTALSLAALVLLLQKNKRIPGYYIWVSCALVAMGVLDLFHSLSPPGESFVWLHSMAVLVGGFLFALVWLPDRIARSRLASRLPVVVSISVIIFSIFSAAFPDIFPVMISEGAFTSSARAINILGGLLFLLAAVHFVVRYRSEHRYEDLLFTNFCLLNGWAGLLFQLSELWYVYWWFWHLLRLIAYFIIVSYIFVFFQSEEKELMQTNETLQAEIAERRRAVEELDRFFNLSLDMFSIVGFDGYFKKLNITWERTLGFTDNELKSKPFIEFVHPEDRKATIDELQKLRTGTETIFFENRYLRRDGSYKWFSWNARPIMEDNLIYAVARDITGRKQTEEELRKSEERFRQIAESAGEWIWEIDAGGLYTYSNPVIEKILGYKPEEIIGKKHFYDMFAPDVREELKKAAFETFARKESFRGFVNPNIHKNGNIIILETSGLPILDERGNLLGYRGADADITERRRAEEGLRESEIRYRTLFDRSIDGILIIDPETAATIEFNEAAHRQLGYTREEFKRLRIFDYEAKEKPEETRARIEKILREGMDDFETRHRTKDGRLRDIRVTVQAIKLSGRVFLYCIFRDVTERKRAEEALRRAYENLEIRVQERTAELARSNAELEQFAYVASHDIQEPLRMVSGFAQLLARRYKGKLGKDADEFIAYIVDGAARMQRMIEDLLAYSRVGTRGKPFEPANLETIFGQAVTNLSVAIEENKARVTHDPLPTAMADPTQMVQLFQNLIANAIKFRKKEEPPRVHVSAQRKGNEWVFSVRDNGIGIAPEDFGRLFQLFQRTYAAREYPGTGIGLAICKKIVERHGGRIWAESEVGRGSTFYFTIPARREERQ